MLQRLIEILPGVVIKPFHEIVCRSLVQIIGQLRVLSDISHLNGNLSHSWGHDEIPDTVILLDLIGGSVSSLHTIAHEELVSFVSNL